jgi:hypothetical protein
MIYGLLFHMAQRETINVNCDPKIAKAFREVADSYKGRIGPCLQAAMLMFMGAHPEQQGEFLRRVYELQIRDGIDELLAKIHAEQRDAVRERGKNRGK